MFSRVTTGYSCEQLVRILMTDTISHEQICSIQHTGVSENASLMLMLFDLRT